MTKRLGIIGYFGQGNTGDRAILTCLTQQLRILGLADRSVVFSADPGYTIGTQGVQAVYSGLPITPRQRLWSRISPRGHRYREALRYFNSCDSLLVGGGGLFYDRPESNRHLLDLLGKIDWAKRRAMRVFVIGVGVGPLHHAESRQAMRRTFSTVDLITVRDRTSWELLRDVGVDPTRVHWTADLAHLLVAAPRQHMESIYQRENMDAFPRPYVALCLRAADMRIESFVASLRAVCEHVLTDLGGTIWFIPFQMGGGEDDSLAPRRVVARLRPNARLRQVQTLYSPPELLSLVGRMDLVVAEKLHGQIFAINSPTPVLGLAYAPKVWALFRDLGHEDWCIPVATRRSDLMIETFCHIWSHRHEIRRELSEKSKEMRLRAQQNFSLLEQCTATRPA